MAHPFRRLVVRRPITASLDGATKRYVAPCTTFIAGSYLNHATRPLTEVGTQDRGCHTACMRICRCRRWSTVVTAGGASRCEMPVARRRRRRGRRRAGRRRWRRTLGANQLIHGAFSFRGAHQARGLVVRRPIPARLDGATEGDTAPTRAGVSRAGLHPPVGPLQVACAHQLPYSVAFTPHQSLPIIALSGTRWGQVPIWGCRR